MPMPHFDFTINLGQVITLVAFVITFVKVFLSFRDMLRDLTKAVGGDDPRRGLVGDVKDLSEKVQEHRDALADAGWLNRRVGQVDRRPH